ncbi:blue copper protein-like isoform X2 [Chenopodium quinoa]|uniref:blue copper protein-like isoform X2 n=1 Tax=Chenopodium quinoa TaxID=63459 RepID=UPI000B77C541|nr:blue copper protein-like isoform X2 [Chenopodium quinoa]
MECKAVKTINAYNLAAVVAAVLQLVLLPVTANAAVYKVGDSAGWTTIGNIDYKKWAATKEFHLSDVIGNDTVTITKRGHYFFLCGVPGHCQSGQKVDIHVLRSTTTSSMAPSPAVSVASSPASPVASAVSPGPSSAAAAVTLSGLLKGLVSITAAAMLAFLLGS